MYWWSIHQISVFFTFCIWMEMFAWSTFCHWQPKIELTKWLFFFDIITNRMNIFCMIHSHTHCMKCTAVHKCVMWAAYFEFRLSTKSSGVGIYLFTHSQTKWNDKNLFVHYISGNLNGWKVWMPSWRNCQTVSARNMIKKKKKKDRGLRQTK